MSQYENEAPSGKFQEEDSYVSRTGHKGENLPVVSDQERVEDPIDEGQADTDAQLARDNNEAIDKSNIMSERTRSSNKTEPGTFREPGDDEGLLLPAGGPEDGKEAE